MAAYPLDVMSLAFIRHGESNVTVQRTIGGFRTCSGLSPLGRSQAERLCDRLATTGELRTDRLVSSNFPRARETAEIIAAGVGATDIEVMPGFGEHDPGPELDGLSFEGYVERFGRPNWSGDPHHDVFPGGETTAAFQLRVGAALSALVRSMSADDTAVVCCHGGVVDATMRALLRTAPTGAFELRTINTSITEFASNGGTNDGIGSTWQLLRYNDAAHLAGLPAATN